MKWCLNQIKHEMDEIMKKNKAGILKEIMGWIIPILFAILVSGIIKAFIIIPVEVQQISMETTLHEGDKLLLYRTGYLLQEPQRGDIVVFTAAKGKFGKWFEIVPLPNPNEIDYVKRVIGVAGDHIELIDGKVVLNNKVVEETYVKSETSAGLAGTSFDVPSDYVFVMGDNRSRSEDSRDFGFISVKQIKGKAILRIWPLKKIGKVY